MKQEFQVLKDKINEFSEEKYADEIENLLQELYELICIIMIYLMEEKETGIRQELMGLYKKICIYIETYNSFEKGTN